MTPIGHVGWHFIREKNLDDLDESINGFFDNPLIKDVKDIKIEPEMSQNRVTGEVVVTYAAYITFYYDKEMYFKNEETTEGDDQLHLDIKGAN